MDVIPATRTPRQSAAREIYQAYLNSPAWRTRRNAALRRARWRCERCASKRGLEVHHTTYERLGHEWDVDLEVTCDNCHRAEHLENPDQTSLGVYLKVAREVVRDQPFATVADLSEEMKLRCAALKIVVIAERVHSAIAVVCGGTKATNPPQTRDEVETRQYRPPTRAEARDVLFRLGLSVLVKSMPAAKASLIDIYGPPDEWVEHGGFRY